MPLPGYEELDRLLADDRRVAAMRLTLLEFTRFPEEWLDDLLETPPWQERLAYVHTIPRELRAYEDYEYEEFSTMMIPTLLLVGANSPEAEHIHARQLAARLPRARVAEIEGEGHVAPVTAPRLVADKITSFAAEAE